MRIDELGFSYECKHQTAKEKQEEKKNKKNHIRAYRVLRNTQYSCFVLIILNITNKKLIEYFDFGFAFRCNEQGKT